MPTLLLLGLVLSTGLLPSHFVAVGVSNLAAQATTVVQNDFEDGTTQGWGPRGSAAVASVTEAAHAGTRSLKTSGRTANWNGPSLNALTLLQKGATYQISGWVRLVTGQPATQLIFTMQRTPTGGSTAFDQVVASSANGVTDGAWVQLQGSYTFATDVTELLLYVESPNATSEYYLDDFTITMTSPPPDPSGAVVENDFEDGTTQGWGPRGSAVPASVTEAAHGGTHSLKTSGRTASWNGPSRDVRTTLLKGATYQISGWVRLVTGQPATQLIFTVQRTPTGGSTAFERVAASPANGVTDGAWVQLQGSYTYTTDVSELLLYLESPDPTSQYYLDDFSIVMTSPPPQDQSGISTNFETNTTEGWQARIGGETLTVTSADKHGGTYSLLTTGRVNTYDGPSLNILGKMHTGSKYNISVWAKLAPSEPTTDLRVSIQRTFNGTTNFDTVIGNTAVTDAAWVNFAGSYTLSNQVDAISIYVESATGAPSFYIDDFTLAFVPSMPIETDIPRLRDVLADDFPIGAAVDPNLLPGIHGDLAKYQFDTLVAENVMKPGPIQPTEGQFNWAPADAMVAFAHANDMLIRGHTLVWHNQNPAWLFLDPSGNPMQPTPENKTLLLQRLEDHIRAVAGRYADDIFAWDVVNEVIDPGQPDCMRRSTWFNITGLDYIRTAFHVAREAAPNAKLFINDYSTTEPVKRACMYNLTRDLIDEGVPIDGVGHQMHINVESPSAAEIENTILMFTDLGVEQQITEMDMSVYTNSTDSYTSVPEEIMVAQGYRYKEIFDVFKRQKEHITAVVVWGLADDNTWLKNFPITRLDLPLLFDEQLQAKHAYWGIVDPSQLPVRIQRLDTSKGTPSGAQSQLLWNMLPWTQLPATDNLSGAFKTLWDEQYLYVLAQVQDATNNAADTVEVFIDDNNGKTPDYQADDAHYTIRRGRPHASGFSASVKPVSGGYLVQAALPLRTAGAMGRQIGFDIRFRDAGDADAPTSWNDSTNAQDADTSRFGTLTLVNAIKLTTAVQGTPVIDATEDAAWANAAEITTNTWVQGSSGATARVKTLWDSGHLYIYATVTDSILGKSSPNPYEEDSVEIFIDQNNAKTGTYQSDDAQYRVNYDNEQSYGGAASADKFVTATRIVPGGYIVEASIALDEIDPAIGTLLGFDFQVNDDGQGNGVRTSVVTWNDPTGNSYRNTSRFGVALFAKRVR